MVETARVQRNPLEQLRHEAQRYRTSTMQTLRREAKAHKDQLLREAQEEIKRAKRRLDLSEPVDSRAQLAESILLSVRQVVTPVIASLNIEPDLNLRVSTEWSQHWLKVLTNYNTINLTMATYGLPRGTPDVHEIAEIMTTVKALIYHEVGHLLYSMPLADLAAEARFQGADVPRPSTIDGALRFEEEIGPYALLDDQRMECALVKMSPVMADYLTTSTTVMLVKVAQDTNAVGDIWPMVCGKSYLPDELLRYLRRAAFAYAHEHDVLASMQVIEHEVAAFKRATTEREMWESMRRIQPALQAWFGDRRTYTNLDHSTHTANKFRPLATPSVNPTTPDVSGGATETPRFSDEDSSGLGQPTNDPAGGSNPTKGEVAASLPDDVTRRLVEKLTPIGEVASVVATLAGAHVRDLERNSLVKPMTEFQSRQAHAVRAEMLDVFMPLTSQEDPSWRFGCEAGIFDPIGYRLREPGDTNYWTSLEESGSPSPSVAVSLVLDASFSMHAMLEDLFVAAVGVRLACDELDVPCTLSTFADEANIVFDAGEPTREIVGIPYGGTDPIEALTDLTNQHSGKDHHLVIVFTDGEWTSGIPHLQHFVREDDVFIGVTLDRKTAASLDKRGFDEVVVLDTISEFSGAVMAALVPYFA